MNALFKDIINGLFLFAPMFLAIAIMSSLAGICASKVRALFSANITESEKGSYAPILIIIISLTILLNFSHTSSDFLHNLIDSYVAKFNIESRITAMVYSVLSILYSLVMGYVAYHNALVGFFLYAQQEAPENMLARIFPLQKNLSREKGDERLITFLEKMNGEYRCGNCGCKLPENEKKSWRGAECQSCAAIFVQKTSQQQK